MSRRDTRTLDLLLDWEPSHVTLGYSDDVAGRGALENQIARLLGRALRDAVENHNLSRVEVARLMAEELGRPVSKDMLDKWASEASGAHRIPLDAFIALIKVTQANDLLGFIPGLLGFAVVPKHYAEIIDMHLIEEKQRELAAELTRLQTRVRRRS